METATALATPQRTTNSYWEQFEQVMKQDSPSWLLPIRKAAMVQFDELGFPTLRHEDWRFTNVAPIAKLPFKPVLEYSRNGLTARDLERFHFAGLKGPRLVFVDGHYSPELSAPLATKDGIRAGSLRAALSSDSGLLEKHLVHATPVSNAFTALNTAFFQDGAFIYVPAGKTLEGPVQLVFISTASEPASIASPRNLIVAEADSKLTIVENYVSLASSAYFTNAVTTIVVGRNAQVEHLKFQDESISGFHMGALQLRLEAQTNVFAHSVALGAKLSRYNIHTHLGGEGIECILNGLYLTKDDQLADHWMLVEHVKPFCNSHEYFNGILDDRSKGVFHGRILVRPEAQKTDAKQTNKNLLLSEDATANTKPQLEIYADDVKCTHGATIGQLNEESIFYLRSRGIGPETARRILIHAFAGEIIDRIRCEPLREELDHIIWDRLEENPHVTG